MHDDAAYKEDLNAINMLIAHIAKLDSDYSASLMTL